MLILRQKIKAFGCAGIQQALNYARILDICRVFSSNGDGFVYHDRTVNDDSIETELALEDLPSRSIMMKYKHYKGIVISNKAKDCFTKILFRMVQRNGHEIANRKLMKP